MEIKEALGQLDTLDDDLWTAEGLPKIDAVEKVLGRKVTRKEITDADPSFKRDLSPPEPKPEDDPDDPLAGLSPQDRIEAEAEAHFMEIDLLIAEKQRQKSRVQEELDVLYIQSQAAELKLNKIRQMKPKGGNNSEISAYLEQSRKSREERAARALAFMAGGTSVQDVLKAMSVKAPIDKALNQRKPAPGSTRPAPNIPVRR